MTNKLSLNVDELRVDSFAAEGDGAGRGTVNGFAISFNTGCDTCGCSSAGANCFCTEALSCRCQ